MQAQGAIDRATGMMRDNIGRIIENRQKMFDIESKSSNLKNTASRFRTQSLKLEKMAKLR